MGVYTLAILLQVPFNFMSIWKLHFLKSFSDFETCIIKALFTLYMILHARLYCMSEHQGCASWYNQHSLNPRFKQCARIRSVRALCIGIKNGFRNYIKVTKSRTRRHFFMHLMNELLPPWIIKNTFDKAMALQKSADSGIVIVLYSNYNI